jgi:hypothetical protein
MLLALLINCNALTNHYHSSVVDGDMESIIDDDLCGACNTPECASVTAHILHEYST